MSGSALREQRARASLEYMEACCYKPSDLPQPLYTTIESSCALQAGPRDIFQAQFMHFSPLAPRQARQVSKNLTSSEAGLVVQRRQGAAFTLAP